MSDPATPIPVPVTLTDFEEAGVATLLASVPDPLDWGPCLQQASVAALSAGHVGRAAVLELLARACALRLEPEQKPSFADGFLPSLDLLVSFEDFGDDEIEFLAQVAPLATPAALQARLADLVWQKGRDRKHTIALLPLVIDAYRAASLDADAWHGGSRDAWLRALQLAISTGRFDDANAIEAALQAAFFAASDDDHYIPLAYLEPMTIAHRKSSALDASAIAQRLWALAHQWQGRHCYHQAVAYYVAAPRWFTLAKDRASARACIVELGLCYEAHGEAAGAAAQAMMYFEKAIQTLRGVPSADRAARRIDERIDVLRGKLRDAGQRALEQLQPVTVSLDVGTLREMAREEVARLSPLEAVRALAGVYPAASLMTVRAGVQRSQAGNVFDVLTDEVFIAGDGRVIARSPANSHSAAEAQKVELGIMVREFSNQIGFAVSVKIIPALNAVWREHALQRADILTLVQESSIVPPGRTRLVARALHAGCVCDFVNAVYLLVPQIEHLVRYHLRESGVQTSTLQPDGIEQEHGLSTLVAEPQMKKLFGEDLTFEIQALFCHQQGPNLRNEVAHGLLDDHGSNGSASVYAWWLLLRMVVTPFGNSARPRDLPDDGVGAG